MNNDNTNNLDYDQTEEEARTCEVSDDALEAASGASAPGIELLSDYVLLRLPLVVVMQGVDNALHQPSPRTTLVN